MVDLEKDQGYCKKHQDRDKEDSNTIIGKRRLAGRPVINSASNGEENKLYSKRSDVSPIIESMIKNLFTINDDSGMTRGLFQVLGE